MGVFLMLLSCDMFEAKEIENTAPSVRIIRPINGETIFDYGILKLKLLITDAENNVEKIQVNWLNEVHEININNNEVNVEKEFEIYTYFNNWRTEPFAKTEKLSVIVIDNEGLTGIAEHNLKPLSDSVKVIDYKYKLKHSPVTYSAGHFYNIRFHTHSKTLRPLHSLRVSASPTSSYYETDLLYSTDSNGFNIFDGLNSKECLWGCSPSNYSVRNAFFIRDSIDIPINLEVMKMYLHFKGHGFYIVEPLIVEK